MFQKHRTKIIFDGNSIPQGYLLKKSYPEIIRDALSCEIINLSVGGQTTLQMIENSKNLLKIDGEILIVDEISNDLYFGATPEQAYHHIIDYCKLSSKKCVIILPTPRENTGTPRDFEIKRQKVANLFRKDFNKTNDPEFYVNSEYATVLIDLTVDSLIGCNSCDTSKIYFQDKCHPTEIGNKYRAEKIIKAILLLQKISPN